MLTIKEELKKFLRENGESSTTELVNHLQSVRSVSKQSVVGVVVRTVNQKDIVRVSPGRFKIGDEK